MRFLRVTSFFFSVLSLRNCPLFFSASCSSLALQISNELHQYIEDVKVLAFDLASWVGRSQSMLKLRSVGFCC
ncbi:hypothetical protein EDC96DRAFT_519626 [Choanephora cucurbitarum]|nr:hypothetical protein EDC96DRAFT_519626 [Choanephora cucurbitarum]